MKIPDYWLEPEESSWYPEETRKEIIERKRNDPTLTSAAIAQEHGMTRSTVNRWWRQAGVNRHAAHYPPELIQQAIDLKRNNPETTVASAAAQLGVSRRTIWNKWADAGLARKRKQSHPEEIRAKAIELMRGNPSLRIKDVASQCGVSPSAVRQWVIGEGLYVPRQYVKGGVVRFKSHPKTHPPEVKDRVLNMKRETPTLTAKEAATLTGISENTIHYWWRLEKLSQGTPHPSYSKESLEQAIQIKLDNPRLSLRDASEQTGITVRAIAAHWKDAGLTIYHPKSHPEEIKAEALKLFADGNTCKGISETLGINYKTINRWVRESK